MQYSHFHKKIVAWPRNSTKFSCYLGLVLWVEKYDMTNEKKCLSVTTCVILWSMTSTNIWSNLAKEYSIYGLVNMIHEDVSLLSHALRLFCGSWAWAQKVK